MNTLKKLTTGALLGVLALTSSMAAQAGNGSDITLPALTAATKAVSARIASDLSAYLTSAVKAPRAIRVRKSPTVTISQIFEPMETVVVAATRLPIATVIVAATRLPMETIVVAATRLPAVTDPVEIAQNVRTAQVRF